MSTNHTSVPGAVTPADTAAPALLDVRDLRVTLATQDGEVTAVNDLNFTLRAGETLGIVGESGCGKSTFARALIGLVKATSGRIAWLGKELQDMNTAQWRATRSDFPENAAPGSEGKSAQHDDEGRAAAQPYQPLSPRVFRWSMPAHRYRPRAQ